MGAVAWEAIYGGIGLVHFAYDTEFGAGRKGLTTDRIWVTACGVAVVLHHDTPTVFHMPQDEFLRHLSVQPMRLEATRCGPCFGALAPAV